jgi:signal transduction histidine kinase/ligand-binding sensor domain-containing protein
MSALLCDSAGVLWIGTSDGLVKYHDGKQTLYTSTQGLSDNHIQSLAEDRDGNLWIGSFGGGVCKLSSELIVTFTRTEGLPNQDVQKVIEDLKGQIYASIHSGGIVKIVEGRAVAVEGSQMARFSDFNDRIFQDRRGDWWMGTDAGLFRFQGPELQLRRGHKFTAVDGISDGPIMSGLYQDPGGKIWVYPQGQGLFDFDPSQKARPVFSQVLSNAIAPAGGVGRMIEDRSGGLWLGAHEQLGKLSNGRLVMFEPTEGLPETRPRAFFLDRRGWLWIGLRYKGVSVTKDPTAESPTFINYSTANGLASDAVWTIAEDDAGRMYFGTGKGLDQLDLTTGRIRHFNTDDGLASDVVNYCMKDTKGNIWVGTTLGLSKFNPHIERHVNQPAPIYLSRVTVAGEDLALPETGALRVPQLELSASRNNLLIEYVALSFQGEDKLRYQYQLEGVDKDWSPPTYVRSINYARLAPGSYRFLVRAINEEGIISPDAATFQFRILRPIWQRWWFLTLAAVLMAMGIYAVHRQRTARLIELERVRTRIATDLHDDIGANLSLIAMMSEVARGQFQRDDHRLKEWFSTIATTSRDTVDAMSDIVWAVNPKRDQLSDLTQRMRRFADDIFAARDIALHFHAAEPGRDVRLGADVRREVFLIFKETINNMVRHSECNNANVELNVERGWLVLQMNDDGKGLDLPRTNEGNGLASMRQRAKKLGGTLEVVSPNGHGTTVTLRVPLGQRARF